MCVLQIIYKGTVLTDGDLVVQRAKRVCIHGEGHPRHIAGEHLK